ncbi:putative polysaccharide biosynthesis protein [Niallia sp. Krafla_26]|uniref:putative polysaccharide biosynthesis protein n=1 Tax=Niallia sp. Krafla_26 TaxID=3064703 RepID=UPI003D182F92
MSSKLLRGTFILTLGTIISKMLGLFYVIPFDAIVGQEGTTLYQYSYVPYTIFISIATGGIPLAISKFISKYNALGEYAVGRKLFKSGQLIMILSGVVSFLVLYSTAPILAGMVIRDTDQVTSLEDVITVTRAVSFALIVVPFMSLSRGFFQGHQSMGPTAVSQVVEQIVRIVFLLGGAYVVLKVMDGDIVTAASVSTFAAFVGAIGGLFVLFWYWRKRKPYLDDLLLQDKGTMQISLKEMYKEIILYAAPFVFVGLANPLFQFIDQVTFNRAMVEIGLAKQADFAYSALNFYSHKLVIIPVSLATAFSLTLVPNITNSFISGDRKEVHAQISQTFQVIFYLTLPAVIGMALLAEPIYTAFYGYDPYGTEVLRYYAPVALLFAIYPVTAAIMQGINEQRYTVLSLLVGLLIKLTLNIPLIKLMETQGAILATVLGYSAAVIINLIVIKKCTNFSFKIVWRRSVLISLFTLFMFLGAGGIYKLLLLFLSPESTLQSILIIAITATVGIVIYGYLGLKSKLVNFLFGTRVEKVKEKLHLRI